MAKEEECRQCNKCKVNSYGALKCSFYGRIPDFNDSSCPNFSQGDIPIESSKVKHYGSFTDYKRSNETFVEQERKPIEKTDRETPNAMPNDGLVWSLVCAVFFFWPVGIAAAVYSSRVDHYWLSGNKSYAMELVQKSKKLRWISFGIAMGVLLLVFILAAVAD